MSGHCATFLDAQPSPFTIAARRRVVSQFAIHFEIREQTSEFLREARSRNAIAPHRWSLWIKVFPQFAVQNTSSRIVDRARLNDNLTPSHYRYYRRLRGQARSRKTSARSLPPSRNVIAVIITSSEMRGRQDLMNSWYIYLLIQLSICIKRLLFLQQFVFFHRNPTTMRLSNFA